MLRAFRRLVLLAVLANLLGASLAWAQEGPTSDVSVSKSGLAEVAAGSNVTYTVTVFNAGPDVAAGITLTDPIPPGMTFVSAAPAGCTAPLPGSGSPPPVSCTIASLAAGASIDFTFVFNIAADTAPGTVFTNIATASTATDPNDENNSGVAVTSTPGPSQADVGVTKTGPAATAPDTDVVYTIVVSNSGPGAASSVTLSDALPGTAPFAMTFVSLSPSSGAGFSCTTPPVGSTGTVTCTIDPLGANASITFTLTGHVPAGTPPGREFANAANVSSPTADPNSENNTSTTTLTVSAIDISVTKTGPPAVNAGETISYTLQVSSAGSGEGETATNVQLSDTLPPNTTFVSLTPSPGPPTPPASTCSTPPVDGTGTVTCTFPTFPSGASAGFTLVIRAGDTTSVTNTVTVGSTEPDANPANNTASATTTIDPRADVGVTNTGPTTATAGSNVTYTVTVTNAGPSTAADAGGATRVLAPASTVTMTYVLPPNTTFVSLNQTTGPTFSCSTPAVGAAGTITCTIATLGPGGSATFVIVLQLSPSTPAGSSVSSTATVTTATVDPNPGNNSATSNATVTVSADVGVTKAGPTAVGAGTNVTYTVTVTNAGPSDAASVSLSDTIPAGTTFVSETQTTGPTFGCATPAPGGTGTITCAIATLPAGASATFSIVVKVASGATGTIANTATVTASTSDPDPANNSSTTSAPVTTGADVSVTKTGPATTAVGANATYTVTVANGGPADATSVSLTDTVPAGTTFVSESQTTGPTFACTTPAVGATGTITCTIATLPAGASATFSIVVKVSSGTTGTVTNTATVSASTSDPIPGNNSASTTATVSPDAADLSIVKTASAPAAGSVTFTIVVTNNGAAAGQNVVVADVLPAGTTLTSVATTQGSCTSGSTVTCALGTLPAGSSVTITIVVSIQNNAAVTNTATVGGSNPDPNLANNSSTAAVGAAAIPTLSTPIFALLALVLIAAGSWVLRRRRPASTR